jgi:LPXTG-motif cell wall-anchored protein
MPSARRLTTLGGAAVVGLATIALFAAPASAHLPNVTVDAKCGNDGTYTITWTVENTYPKSENPRHPEKSAMTLHDVKFAPKTLSNDGKIADDVTVEGASGENKPGKVVGVVTVPGDSTFAKLSFLPTWGDGYTVDEPIVGAKKLEGTCKPTESSPTPPTGGGGGGGEGSPTPSASSSTPSLPVTGSQTGLYAGGAVVLLGAGAGLFVMARRRRVKFEA